MISISGVLPLLVFASLSAARASLSPQCADTLTNVLANPDVVRCLQPSSLLSILGKGDTSIVGPINDWLGSFCPAPACSNVTLTTMVANMTAGCGSDLGIDPSDSSDLAEMVVEIFPTIKDMMCLKDGKTFCITETLTNIQSVVGPVTIEKFADLASETMNFPANITCTNCIKAAYNIIDEAPQLNVTGLRQTLSEECGSDFVNGQSPSGITSTASNSTTNAGSGSSAQKSKSGASALNFSQATSLSVLLTVLGGFALLV